LWGRTAFGAGQRRWPLPLGLRLRRPWGKFSPAARATLPFIVIDSLGQEDEEICGAERNSVLQWLPNPENAVGSGEKASPESEVRGPVSEEKS
jgi:hypothetical protein